MNMHHLLVPLDGSSWSDAIVPTLCQLLDPKQYHVTLLRVAEEPVGVGLLPEPQFVDPRLASNYPPTGAWQPAIHPIYDIQVEESERAELEDALHVAAQPLRAAGFTVALVVRFGDPAEEIVAATKVQCVDLIAMTTHGRTGMRRVLLGSVAEQVMRSAQVPVLLLRPLAPPPAWPRTDVADIRLPR